MSRVITAAIVLPILVASIIFSFLAPLFVLLASAAMVMGLFEFWVLAKSRSTNPDAAIGYLGAAALFTSFYFDAPAQSPIMLLLCVIAFVIGTLVSQMAKGVGFDKMVSSAGATILGVLYVVLMGGHLVAVRTGFREPLNAHLLSFFFLVIMGADAGAYYLGRLAGKHKLAPSVSPGKTWEGAAGGMVVSLLAALLAHSWFFHEIDIRAALPLAAVMNILAVLGDLTESALKRGAGKKDAAKILPGHGGILDRLDSLLFNAPLIYYFGRYYFP